MKHPSASDTLPPDTTSSDRLFATIVPALRTIPGVEIFDYAIDKKNNLTPGNIIRIPFRKKNIPGLILEIKSESAYAAKAKDIADSTILLDIGNTGCDLLDATAQRTQSSRPSVLTSWIRQIPKRALSFKPTARQLALQGNKIETTFSLDPAKDLIDQAKQSPGRTLIVVPWISQAQKISVALGVPSLDSTTAMAKAWNSLKAFAESTESILVTTKIGAWLASVADTVLVLEPENDDHKQDEMAPRYDARWLISQANLSRHDLTVRYFSLTPRLGANVFPTFEISADIIREPITKASRSDIRGISSVSVNSMREALEDGRSVYLIHPITGLRARHTCSDCGWQATCSSCGFGLSAVGNTGLCKKCGRKGQPLPISCPNCQGTKFDRSVAGIETIRALLEKSFGAGTLTPLTTTQAFETDFAPSSFVLLTDIDLLAGALEDIRRRERLIIAWRRLTAKIQASSAILMVQGKDTSLGECLSWLTPQGLKTAWDKEMADRALFGYPPAKRLIKLLVDGNMSSATAILKDITNVVPSGFQLNGPFPVPFRADTRTARWVIQLTCPAETRDHELSEMLKPFRSKALIDLDPIAFFS
ncbi:MAG: hypothetical protein RDU25_03630 [Patescibacteria group bacterium]|nr:hypothetical protein [Patescibacteria group bacterium]